MLWVGNFTKWGWFDLNSLLRQAMEQLTPGCGCPPVEAECEFVEIVVHVFVFDGPLVGAHEPPLEE